MSAYRAVQEFVGPSEKFVAGHVEAVRAAAEAAIQPKVDAALLAWERRTKRAIVKPENPILPDGQTREEYDASFADKKLAV